MISTSKRGNTSVVRREELNVVSCVLLYQRFQRLYMIFFFLSIVERSVDNKKVRKESDREKQSDRRKHDRLEGNNRESKRDHLFLNYCFLSLLSANPLLSALFFLPSREGCFFPIRAVPIDSAINLANPSRNLYPKNLSQRIKS